MTTAGLDQIVQQYRENGGGVEVAAGATLEVVLGRVANALERRETRQMRFWENIQTVPIRTQALSNLAGTSGKIDVPDALGPHEGFWWDVDRITLWGWTAGTVTVYINDPLAEPLMQVSGPSQGTWGKKQASLAPRDRLIVVATTVTGTVNIAGSATQVTAAYWPEYVI